MKKSTIILWGVAALFLLCSLPFFGKGEIAEGGCGIGIAAVLFFVGLRKKKAAPKPSMPNVPPITNAPPVPKQPEAQPAAAPAAIPSAPPIVTDKKPPQYTQNGFDFLRVKVAGVTFKNGRKSRQTILRKIHFKDEPFDKGNMELTLQREEWEGAPAFGVYVNGEQIGNIPAEYVSYVQENFSRCEGITNIEVYGGGEGRNYGAEIILRFRKDG